MRISDWSLDVCSSDLATADQVARYLTAYAGQLAHNTLKHRLAALAQWHHAHGFADPTRAPVVRKVLKGIQTLHPSQEKRATPLQLTQRSEEHTSELQSLMRISYAVFCLKKKKP